MNNNKMSDFEINCKVAFHIGLETVKLAESGIFNPCQNVTDAWPIISENNISLILDNPTMPCATDNARDLFDDADPLVNVIYDNPLRAAMMVFLMMQESANTAGDKKSDSSLLGACSTN